MLICEAHRPMFAGACMRKSTCRVVWSGCACGGPCCCRACGPCWRAAARGSSDARRGSCVWAGSCALAGCFDACSATTRSATQSKGSLALSPHDAHAYAPGVDVKPLPRWVAGLTAQGCGSACLTGIAGSATPRAAALGACQHRPRFYKGRVPAAALNSLQNRLCSEAA